MTNPGSPINGQPSALAIEMSHDFRGALRLLVAMGLGSITVEELLTGVEEVVDELDELSEPPAN